MSNEPRSGWQIWFPDLEEDTDAVLWESDFTTAAEVVRDVYYWHHFATSDTSSLEVAVVSPEGETTFWEVYEVCTIKVQQMKGEK